MRRLVWGITLCRAYRMAEHSVRRALDASGSVGPSTREDVLELLQPVVWGARLSIVDENIDSSSTCALSTKRL